MADDRGTWLSDNKIYQNVRNSLTFTEVSDLEACGSWNRSAQPAEKVAQQPSVLH